MNTDWLDRNLPERYDPEEAQQHIDQQYRYGWAHWFSSAARRLAPEAASQT